MKIKIIILGLVGISLFGLHASARGLVGERYFGIDGGWERLDNGDSDEGWGVGAELNMPFQMAGRQLQYGSDLRLRGDYKDVFDRDIYDVNAVIRGFMQPTRTGFTSFAGAGVGWVDFDAEDSIYLPVEAGLQFALGPISLIPYVRYSFAFDSAVDDFWSAGANSVFWLGDAWGVTASIAYTDYDDIGGLEGIDSGVGVRLGLVFSY
jgi:hypothetical protein